uniref:hypothetical protein n=1 Tax=Sphingomonas bacterium TaxID=1895847 RepID=UPI00260AA933|nr:hypothetical protein [Sphingomonas bacterium]
MKTTRGLLPALTLLFAAPVAAQETPAPAPPPPPRPVLSIAPVRPATMPSGVAGPANPSAFPARPASTGPGEVARQAPINGVLTLYGNQRCPTDKEGSEVVVCVRQGAAEQYRIPKALRTFQVTPENESWASKVVAHDDVANAGIGSCTTVGPGGSTGCFLQQARQQRAEKKDNKAADQRVQDSLP